MKFMAFWWMGRGVGRLWRAIHQVAGKKNEFFRLLNAIPHIWRVDSLIWKHKQ
jgi:hypothetical protein